MIIHDALLLVNQRENSYRTDHSKIAQREDRNYTYYTYIRCDYKYVRICLTVVAPPYMVNRIVPRLARGSLPDRQSSWSSFRGIGYSRAHIRKSLVIILKRDVTRRGSNDRRRILRC